MNSISAATGAENDVAHYLQPFSLGVRDSDETNFPPLAVTEEGKGGLRSLM